MTGEKEKHFFAICGETESRELLKDALAVLEGMGLETGDIVISSKEITVVPCEHNRKVWRR